MDQASGNQLAQGPVASQNAGFGTSSIVRANETASTALAAQAQAQIQARYIIAMQRPRSWDQVRARLLAECQRPGFADVARYQKPTGKRKNKETNEWEQTYAEGFTIRFAEAALRCMGNVSPEQSVIWDDEDKRIVRVNVVDVESNVSYGSDIVIPKTVERSSLKEGQIAISVRVNSSGYKTYTVGATDDDVLNKANALISKALRTQAMRILPGDIQDDCIEQIAATIRNRDAKDPDAARKKLLDSFARLSVMPNQIAEYLGHDPGQMVPAELQELRAVYVAISEGEATWVGVLEAKKGNGDDKPSTDAKTAQKAVDNVKARLAKKKEPAPSAAAQAPIEAKGETVAATVADGGEPQANPDGSLDRDPPK